MGSPLIQTISLLYLLPPRLLTPANWQLMVVLLSTNTFLFFHTFDKIVKSCMSKKIIGSLSTHCGQFKKRFQSRNKGKYTQRHSYLTTITGSTHYCALWVQRRGAAVGVMLGPCIVAVWPPIPGSALHGAMLRILTRTERKREPITIGYMHGYSFSLVL